MGGGGKKSSRHDPAAFNGDLGSDIQRAYEKGPADQFGKSMYTGMGTTTRGGIAGMLATANENRGYTRPAMNFAQGLISGADDPSLTEQTLMGVARGNAFGQEAPGYARVRQGVADDTLSGVNGLFANMGRYGGGSHVGTATESLADSLAGLDYQNYQNDIARQERALGMIEGTRQQGVSNAMGATAALPGIYHASLMPGQTQLAAGQMQDADAMARRQAERELFERNNDPNYSHIAKYLALAGGQSQGAQPEKEPGLFDWMGLGGATLAGIF